MSAVLYPLGLIRRIQVSPFAPVIADEFEAGNSSSHLLWSAQNFKRTIKVQHSPLTMGEWLYLRSFYSQRNGGYDSFYFRDNPNRGGNFQVRFASEVAPDRESMMNDVEVSMQEIAPIRAMPELDELTTAAGLAPMLWYDANRCRYWTHAGTVTAEGTLYDVTELYPGTFRAGQLNLYNIAGQYQDLSSEGTTWIRNDSFVVGGTQPALTLFCIAKQSSTATKQVLVSLGTTGASNALGIVQAADNYYEPWVGGTETWTNARSNNSAADTYRSVAVAWTSASNTATLYVNAALVGADAVTRSLISGPFTVGASPSGTLISNPSNAMAHHHLAHVLCFNATLTLAQIKAVHNLLGYQYGLSSV